MSLESLFSALDRGRVTMEVFVSARDMLDKTEHDSQYDTMSEQHEYE